MQHLRSLAAAGLSHVHLLPCYDFGSVDEDRTMWKSPAGDLAAMASDSGGQQAAVTAVADVDAYNWGRVQSSDRSLPARGRPCRGLPHGRTAWHRAHSLVWPWVWFRPVCVARPPCTVVKFSRYSTEYWCSSMRYRYDPVHWGVPDGSYATQPDGATRLLEFRQMVDAINSMGLRVVVDVVYNHTFAAGPISRRGSVHTLLSCPPFPGLLHWAVAAGMTNQGDMD